MTPATPKTDKSGNGIGGITMATAVPLSIVFLLLGAIGGGAASWGLVQGDVSQNKRDIAANKIVIDEFRRDISAVRETVARSDERLKNIEEITRAIRDGGGHP